ncbi:MAG: hypothetical protein IPK58_12805 [Acidobacteria bacterium]|nr:hypothetical protein [Acidobacteriota bacterium]
MIEVLREEFPEYAFEIADDVLNVFPADIKDESLARLLDLRIDHFDLGRFGNRNTLRDSIYELPEVEAFRLENKLEAVKAYNATNANFVLDDRAPKRLSGLTIKNLLNTIVRYSSSKFWLVKRYGEKGDKLLLSF